MCFPFPLDLDRRIPLAFGFCSFRLGSRVRCFCLPLVPWVGFIVCLVAPLLFSVWLPSALWVSFSWHLSLPRLVGLFATVSSFAFQLLLSLAASSVPLFLLCSTLLLWVVLWPLGGLLCSFGLTPFSILARKLLSPVLGFQLLVLGFPVGLQRVFLSCAIAFLSSSRILLLCRGSLWALFRVATGKKQACFFFSEKNVFFFSRKNTA